MESLSALLQQDEALRTDALALARARSQAGRCGAADCTIGSPHGVRIEPSLFIVFQGASYGERDPDQDLSFPRGERAAAPAGEFVFGHGTGRIETRP